MDNTVFTILKGNIESTGKHGSNLCSAPIKNYPENPRGGKLKIPISVLPTGFFQKLADLMMMTLKAGIIQNGSMQDNDLSP